MHNDVRRIFRLRLEFYGAHSKSAIYMDIYIVADLLLSLNAGINSNDKQKLVSLLQ